MMFGPHYKAAQQVEVSRLWLADDRPAAAALAAPQPFSPGSVGPCRGEGRPDPAGKAVRLDRGVPRPSLWRRLRALDDRINDCWIGDLLGIASLVVLATYAPIGLPMLIIIFGGNP